MKFAQLLSGSGDRLVPGREVSVFVLTLTSEGSENLCEFWSVCEWTLLYAR